MLISVVVQLAGSIIILVVGLRRYTRASLENVEAS
jgi:hypothetical protein